MSQFVGSHVIGRKAMGSRITGERHASTNGVAWGEIARLALVVSVVAALVSVAAASLAEISTTVLVLAVMVVAFATSWVVTSRSMR